MDDDGLTLRHLNYRVYGFYGVSSVSLVLGDFDDCDREATSLAARDSEWIFSVAWIVCGGWNLGFHGGGK